MGRAAASRTGSRYAAPSISSDAFPLTTSVAPVFRERAAASTTVGRASSLDARAAASKSVSCSRSRSRACGCSRISDRKELPGGCGWGLAAVISALAYDARAVFDAARQSDRLACAVVDEVARRIALHVAPISAVADVELVVLGGGIGANGDLPLQPVRRHLSEWLPYQPRVEVSTVGEAAVLTGALSVGLRSALDNVVAKRTAA